MKFRDRLFEFEDLSWFPNSIREAMTDHLRLYLAMLDFYQPITPMLAEVLREARSDRIVDLCSGGGGAIEVIRKNITEETGKDVRITLTDKYPNVNAFELISVRTNGSITYATESVDATSVPQSLEGIRTMFSAFHHFDEVTAKAIIKDAVNSRVGVAFFDGYDRNILVMLGIIFSHPFTFFFLTPFIKPVRLSRFVFTYLLPIIPLCTIWDGVVSILRLYKPGDLQRMANEVASEGYVWKSGFRRNKYGIGVAYLIGYPI